jgi:hypothetical protein
LVTGGFGSEGYLSSSEVFRENSWVVGPALPVAIEGHCQVLVGENVIIVGELLYVKFQTPLTCFY